MAPPVLTTVRNALRVLKDFRDEPGELGLSEIARRVELGKSTVYRLVSTLVSEGFLTRDESSGRYRLGLVLAELGAAAAINRDLHAAAIGPLDELWKLTGETVQLALLDGRQVVFVERIESPHTLRLFNEVGRRNWAHASGTGKVLLAFLPEVEFEELLEGWDLHAVTQHTITDHGALREELGRVRTRGYSQNVNESSVGIVSVGAPIRDATGRVIAAVSSAGPALRLQAGAIESHAGAVLAAAEAVSRNLGWRPRAGDLHGA